MNAMEKPHQALPFPVVDQCLQVGGMPLTRLAQRVGRTPFYVYERDTVTACVQAVRQAMPDKLRVQYSVKANPMPALVQHMAHLVDGFDVSSGSELKTALDTTLAATNISFSGPGKSEPDLQRAVAAGAVINAESTGELQRLARIGDRLGLLPRVALRINPAFELRSSGMRMGGGAKQFGIDEEQAPQAMAQLAALGLDFQGLHIFAGSQCLNAEAIVAAQAQAMLLAHRLAAQAPQPMRQLNIGGGFGIPYFPGDRPLDLRPIGEHLDQALVRWHQEFPASDVAMELGRFLVSPAGLYVARIIDRKVSRGQVYLVVDGGMHHHLAASGNLGQVIRKNYPVAIANRMGQDHVEKVIIAGPLCTPLDTLADRVWLPYADVGDLVVIFQSGAYGLTASPTAFLGHPLPEEVLV